MFPFGSATTAASPSKSTLSIRDTKINGFARKNIASRGTPRNERSKKNERPDPKARRQGWSGQLFIAIRGAPSARRETSKPVRDSPRHQGQRRQATAGACHRRREGHARRPHQGNRGGLARAVVSEPRAPY